MVVPCAAAVGAATNVGATALGLGMGKSDLELSREVFQQQMRQTKRLWTADWAEASVRHGEQLMQAAQQHSEAQAMSTAAYYQAEKLASQGIKLARDQDSRAYEMAWRAEVRESLRDELGNQNNRFNIVMLCDTVCLGCVFTLVADGSPPVETPGPMLKAYVFFLGVSIMLFSTSLWGSVIVVRRLHDNTAARLERKLFSQSEDLQSVWREQLAQNLPTGPQEMYLVHQAYEKWVAEHLDPIAKPAIHMMSFGVVTMFVTAGLLVHNQYLIEFDSGISVPAIFWAFVAVTSGTVLFMKIAEDSKERRKEGVYDISWHDNDTDSTGPFAKITRAAGELSGRQAVSLGSEERIDAFKRQEERERKRCNNTDSLYRRVEDLRNEAHMRTKTRKDVLQLLTTAAEELEALPEELTSRLNKLLLSIDEADAKTAELVTENRGSLLQHEGSRSDWSRLSRRTQESIAPMAVYPIDAQRISVSLPVLRKKLGSISLTTLLRLRNTSEEPLRLSSGVRLTSGKYITSLHAVDPKKNSVCYQLYPGTEIPPRSELLIVARSGGTWIPTSGIEGEIVYTNKEETWNFRITFENRIVGNIRRCRVEAYPSANDDDDSVTLNDNDEEHWQISKEEVDRKANNEILITVSMLHGDAAAKALARQRQSRLTLHDGYLQKKNSYGIWQKKWTVLTPNEILFSHGEEGKEISRISLTSVKAVKPYTDLVKAYTFEILSTNVDTKKGPLRLAAQSSRARDSWIDSILKARGTSESPVAASSSDESTASEEYGGFECVHDVGGVNVVGA